MEKEGQEKKVVGENTPEAGVNAASAQLPFTYKDVARQVAENAWRLDRDGWRNWYPVVVYYNRDKGLFTADPGVCVPQGSIKIYEFKPNEDRNLPGRDYSTRYSGGYDDFDDDEDQYGALPSFQDDLYEALAYARGTIEPYLVKKMQKENLAAKWAAVIHEASKNE